MMTANDARVCEAHVLLRVAVGAAPSGPPTRIKMRALRSSLLADAASRDDVAATILEDVADGGPAGVLWHAPIGPQARAALASLQTKRRRSTRIRPRSRRGPSRVNTFPIDSDDQAPPRSLN